MLVYYLITVLAVSLIAFLLFATDKASARRGGDRIPELVLLTVSALGGGLGALLGQVLLHHKSNARRKLHFAVTVTLSALLQTVLLFYLALV